MKLIPYKHPFIKTAKPVAKNVSATLTKQELVWSGVITSTSNAAVTLTTPTAKEALSCIDGGGVGSTFDLIIDNSNGRETVTLALDSSISVTTPAITGGAALTVTTANKVGLFRFYFTSATTAHVFRIY